MTSTSKINLSLLGGMLLFAWGVAQSQASIRIEAEDMQLHGLQIEKPRSPLIRLW